MRATYTSVQLRGRTWYRPAILDVDLQVLWAGDVLLSTPNQATALAKAAM